MLLQHKSFFSACKNLETHLWPISCAMVKAEPRPMSSLMLQLLSGSHIPATEAKPEHTKQTSRQNKAGSRNWECKIDQITVLFSGKILFRFIPMTVFNLELQPMTEQLGFLPKKMSKFPQVLMVLFPSA